MHNDFKMIAKTFFGFENILADELLKLGAKKILIGVRNVSFYGDLGFLFKSNLSIANSESNFSRSFPGDQPNKHK